MAAASSGLKYTSTHGGRPAAAPVMNGGEIILNLLEQKKTKQ
jgi:hypothetical protein